MRNFNRDNNSRGGHRGGGGYSRNRNFGDRGDYGGDRKQMYDAVCSNCGKDCKVPFKPTGDKPVYCSDCFENMGGGKNRRPSDRNRRGGGGYSDDKYKVQFESLNKKLDKVIELLQSKNIDKVSSTVEPKVEETEPKKSRSKKVVKEKTTKKTKKAS